MDICAQLGNKFSSLDDQLEFLSRQLNLHQRFLKHKFQREFEEFVEDPERFEASGRKDDDTPNVSVSADAVFTNSAVTYGLPGTSSTNEQDEQGEDFEEEKCNPSGFVEPAEPDHSEFCYTEFLSTLRLSNSDAKAQEALQSDLETSASRRSEDSNLPSGTPSIAVIPSSSSNGVRRLQEKKRVEEECEQNLRICPCPMELRSRSRNATERKQPTAKGIDETASDGDFGNVEESDEDGEASLASGGTSSDSSSSEDATESDSEVLRRGVGFGTRRTRLLRKQKPRHVTPSGSSTVSPQKQNRPKEKRFKCSYCDKAFRAVETKRDHELIHTNEKPHKCPSCDKWFRQTSSLRRHKLTHTGEKPHKCSVCQKCFRRSAHLRSHEFSHTGEKPFKCSFCVKSYFDRRDLRHHEEKHRPPQ